MPEKTDKDFSDFQSPHEANVDLLVRALDRAYHRPWLLMWRSFLQGIMAAIGAVVGTALMGIVSVYLFQALGGFEIFKPLVDRFQQTIVQSSSKAIQESNARNQ